MQRGREMKTVVLLLLIAAAAAGQMQITVPHPTNLDFSEGEVGAFPPGWAFPTVVAEAGYRAELRRGDCGETFAACVQYLPPPLIGSVRAAELQQEFPAAPYQGRKVRFSAWLRLQNAADGYIHVRMRVYYPNASSELFDSDAQPVDSAVWQRRDVFGYVGPDAAAIAIWARYVPHGDAWVDAPSFSIVDSFPRGDDEFSVRALMKAFADARNAHDGNAAAALYSEDGAYLGIKGTGVHGRQAIANIWSNVPPREVQRTVQSVDFPSPDMAVVRVAGQFPDPAGLHHETFLAIRDDGAWFWSIRLHQLLD